MHPVTMVATTTTPITVLLKKLCSVRCLFAYYVFVRWNRQWKLFIMLWNTMDFKNENEQNSESFECILLLCFVSFWFLCLPLLTTKTMTTWNGMIITTIRTTMRSTLMVMILLFGYCLHFVCVCVYLFVCVPCTNDNASNMIMANIHNVVAAIEVIDDDRWIELDTIHTTTVILIRILLLLLVLKKVTNEQKGMNRKCSCYRTEN